MITATVTVNNFLLLSLLFIINIEEIFAELNYDLHRYNLQQQSNLPLSIENIEIRPGFRLKTGSTNQRRAELSWLAANTESNQQPPVIAARHAQSFYLTTKQPQGIIPSLSANHVSHYQQHYYGDQQNAQNSWLATNTESKWQAVSIVAPYARAFHLTTVVPLLSQDSINSYHRYYAELPTIHPTFSPVYYATNFQTIPPIYYNDYLIPTFVPPTYPPVSTMVTAIRNILSVLRKAMYPDDNVDNDFNTSQDLMKDANLTINKPQSLLLSALLPLLSSSSSSSSSSSVVTGTGKEDEMAVTSMLGNNGDTETKQLVNVAHSKETEKMENITITAITTTTTTTTTATTTTITTTTTTTTMATTTMATTAITTTTATTSSIDDGSNLLGSLLNGRLGNIDWFGSFFGTNQLPTKEEGNALAQIFQGGIFGPGN